MSRWHRSPVFARSLVVSSFRELRLHPSRYAAIVLAVLISVGLLTGSQVFAATEASAIAKRALLYASRADVIVDSHVWNSARAVLDRDEGLAAAEASLAANPLVTDVERFSQLYVQLSADGRFTNVMLNASPTAERLRWYTATRGRLPQNPGEIVLTLASAQDLGVPLGGRVQLGVSGWKTELTVVGLTDEAGYSDPPAYVPLQTILTASENLPPTNTSAITNPRSTEQFTPGSSGTGVGLRLLVANRSPADAPAVVAQTQADLDARNVMKIYVQPKTAAQMRAEATDTLTDQTSWMTGVLATCGVLAIMLGSVVVANTFSLLLARQRRQIALLRLMGASRGQVTMRYASEATILAVVGILVGAPLGAGLAAAASGVWTHSLTLGLVIPATLAILLPSALVLIVAGVLVAIAPATAARPLEALGAASSERSARRPWVWFAVAASVAGAALVGYGIGDSSARLAWLTVGAVALALGIAGLLPAVLPTLLALARPLVRRPVGRLAFGNLLRHRSRTRAAAAGMVLAVGLIGAVLAGVGSGRASALADIDRTRPVDLSLQASSPPLDSIDGSGSGTLPPRDKDGNLIGLSADALGTVVATPGIASAALFPTTEPVWIIAGTAIADRLPVAALTADAQGLLNAPIHLAPHEIGLPRSSIDALKIREGSLVHLVPVLGKEVTATVVEANVNENLAVAPPELLAQLNTPTNPGLILARVDDPDHAGTVIERLTAALTPDNPGLTIDGSMSARVGLTAQLEAATRLVLGLVGLAALVAVIGLANTLSLSVVERARESALLRALGFQRSDLERMVLIEAVALCGTAGLLGVPLGLLTGWLGASIVIGALGLGIPPLVVPWAALVALWAGTVLVAALAATLPARRAGRTAPIEALSDVG